MDRRPELSLTEWLVLGLVVERPRHGYDIAGQLASGTALGRVWTVRRPAVYRALERLQALGHVRPARTEDPPGAPPRTIHEPTTDGREALEAWLRAPVQHLRDVRSDLLAKVVLSRRLDVPVTALADAQREVLGPQLEALGSPSGDDDVVRRWRHHAARAVAAFLDDLGA